MDLSPLFYIISFKFVILFMESFIRACSSIPVLYFSYLNMYSFYYILYLFFLYYFVHVLINFHFIKFINHNSFHSLIYFIHFICVFIHSFILFSML